MEECNICPSKIKNRGKHHLTKKQKYFSNLIINKYIVKTMKLINLKTSFNHTMTNIKKNLMT